MLDRDLSWLDATCRAAVEVSDRNRNLPAHIHSLLKLEISQLIVSPQSLYQAAPVHH